MSQCPRVLRGLWLPFAIAVSACSDAPALERLSFGVSVSGFQVEMGCPTIAPEACEDRRSDWYHFITSTVTQSRGSNFLSGDPPSLGPGYFELYESDIDRVVELGLDRFRISVEWSRIFPTSTRGVEGRAALSAIASVDALEYYRKQLSYMRSRGIEPLVTLNHYTLPDWMHDAVGCNTNLTTCSPRGWLEEDIVEEIAKYAGFVAGELGDQIDLWATLNEPFAVVLPGYLQPTEVRTNPPAASLRVMEAKTAALNMIDAHAAIYDAVHAADRVDADGDGAAARVGVVYAVAPVHPKDPENPLDRLAAKNVSYLFNWLFLDAVVLGRLDDDFDGVAEEKPSLVGRSDYLGLNYYTRAVVEGTDEPVFAELSPLSTFNPLTLEQGEPYAEGLFEVLEAISERYPSVPVMITENGVDADREPDATSFLIEHLEQLTRAMDAGAKVEAYFWWSLVDNYEWNHGMRQRFGLYSVEPSDPAKGRVAREVADAYRRIATKRTLH